MKREQLTFDERPLKKDIERAIQLRLQLEETTTNSIEDIRSQERMLEKPQKHVDDKSHAGLRKPSKI